MQTSKIEWTDATWNPVTGCTKVSDGCKYCYAERIHKRFYPNSDFLPLLHRDRLDAPLRKRKPQKIFVCSMSDLFHEWIPFEFIAEVFETMIGECSHKAAPDHTYQILTKRPQRMLAFFDWCADHEDENQAALYLSQQKTSRRIWLGVSVENQKTADQRIPILLKVPASVHFVSCEPLLSSVNLLAYLPPAWCEQCHDTGNIYVDCQNELSGYDYRVTCPCRTNAYLDWVIVGGESGPRSRTDHKQLEIWASAIREQCADIGVPFFMKQMGGRIYKEIPRWLQVREFPEV